MELVYRIRYGYHNAKMQRLAKYVSSYKQCCEASHLSSDILVTKYCTRSSSSVDGDEEVVGD